MEINTGRWYANGITTGSFCNREIGSPFGVLFNHRAENDFARIHYCRPVAGRLFLFVILLWLTFGGRSHFRVRANKNEPVKILYDISDNIFNVRLRLSFFMAPPPSGIGNNVLRYIVDEKLRGRLYNNIVYVFYHTFYYFQFYRLTNEYALNGVFIIRNLYQSIFFQHKASCLYFIRAEKYVYIPAIKYIRIPPSRQNGFVRKMCRIPYIRISI